MSQRPGVVGIQGCLIGAVLGLAVSVLLFFAFAQNDACMMGGFILTAAVSVLGGGIWGTLQRRKRDPQELKALDDFFARAKSAVRIQKYSSGGLLRPASITFEFGNLEFADAFEKLNGGAVPD